MQYYQSVKLPLKAGFTLIELSIVLVIIGLIIGGVLVGRDLIDAASIRAQISQIEKYNAAVNTFRGKYGYLPGDMPAALASSFGMIVRSGAIGHGDGNGVIEGCSANATVAGCETLLFWTDLSSAKLIDGGFSSASDNLTQMVWLGFGDEDMMEADRFSFISEAWAPPGLLSKDLLLPKAKIGRGNYLTVFSATGTNYFQIAGVVSTDTLGNYTLSNDLTPQQMFNIDSKTDDGLPLFGKVQAMEGTGPLNTQAVPGAATCAYNVGSPSPYNTSTSTLANTMLCQLRVNFN